MGTEKALLRVDGRPLVSLVAARLSEACHPVLVAPGTPGRLGPLAYHQIADAVAGAGPLGGLVAALEASPHPLLAAVAVDMPFVSPQLLSFLAALHTGEDAVVPVTGGGRQPLHAVYSASALPALREALSAGVLSLRAVLGELRVRVVGEPEWGLVTPTARFAVNLNFPADMRELAPSIVEPAGP
jgi:molybdopterin-guanine dinucleotide biosynthesis protein A